MPSEQLQERLQKLVDEFTKQLNSAKSVTIDQAWKILQLAIADIIQVIEIKVIGVKGSDKKAIAMELLSKFYDTVFLVVDVPFVPNLVEPIIHKYVKSLLMMLASSTIDAMVTTFKNVGIFSSSQVEPELPQIPNL
jgi:hypothetical protein